MYNELTERPYRVQKNTTLPPEQIKFIKQNANLMTIKKMAEHLGVNMGKVYGNMKVLGIRKKKIYPFRKNKNYRKVIDKPARVIDFGTNGFFDEKKWMKIINY